jgi:hypothetical protein
MKCLQLGGLLDFYGEAFSSRRRPHRAESAYFAGEAFRHSFLALPCARQEATGGQRSTSPPDETLRI